MVNEMKKIKVILAGTGEFAYTVIEKMQMDERMNVLGVICDESVGEEENRGYLEKLRSKGIQPMFMNDGDLERADIIFVCEYRKIIAKEIVKKYFFVNCHAGILPEYKGFSANAWAIINGESEIGYTIHRVDEGIDNGDIFYVGRFKILKEDTYADWHDRILQDIAINICDILEGIYKKDLLPQRQEKLGVYCTRFYPAMGDLKTFDETSEYFYNLYRSMAQPHGTGVYFWYKGSKYMVGKMKMGTDIGMQDYIGIPGKIVNCGHGELWVKTRDNIVILSKVTMENGQAVADGLFKIGNKLGK